MSNFDISPNNYLGQDHADFVNKMLSLSLTKPALYFEAKGNATFNLKREVVSNFYANIHSVLQNGLIKDSKGNIISVYSNGATNNIAARDYQPKYPDQKIVDIGLSFSATIDKMLDEIVNILFPHNINKVVLDKLGEIGQKTISS